MRVEGQSCPHLLLFMSQWVPGKRSPELQYLNVQVQHQGNLIPANFIQVKMYDKPIVLATMGQGFPIFRYPVHVTQTVLPSKAPLYTRQEG